MKMKQKLPMADGRWPIKRQRAIVFPGSIVNRPPSAVLLRRTGKSQIVNVPAFTLIELLTVIAVIAVIAALIFPVANTVKRQAFLHNAQAQMSQLETALENYKSAWGFYPPSCPNGPLTNQLYYELSGTILTNASYMTLDRTATIPVSSLSTVFGPGVGGFMNCNKPGADESVQQARNFLPDLNTNQVYTALVNGKQFSLLVTPVGGPDGSYNPLGVANNAGANPWRYAYPGINNPASYDLWIQLEIAGNSNLICNWTKQVQLNNRSVP